MLAFLRHLFTPHYTNNHRARALHPQILFIYVLFFFFLKLNFSNLTVLAPDILGLATDINVEKLLTFTNQKREAAGSKSLNLNPQLSQAANEKAKDMFGKDYWAHNAPDGGTPWVFIRGSGYNYLYAGENLAKNFSNSEGVVKAWMASSSHRTNLLKAEYEDVGFAVVNGRLNGEETTLVVQMFGTRQKTEIAAKPLPSPSPTVGAFPSLTVTPFPEAGVATEKATLAGALRFPQALLMTAQEVKNQPTFDIFSLTKNSTLLLAGFLLLLLILDTIFIWRRKIVRVSGHNLAHFFLLGMVVLALWVTQQGAVR